MLSVARCLLQMAASGVMYCIPPVLDIFFLAALVLFLFALSGTVLFLGTVEGASNFNGSTADPIAKQQQTPLKSTTYTCAHNAHLCTCDCSALGHKRKP
jgi:hypothetical protein